MINLEHIGLGAESENKADMPLDLNHLLVKNKATTFFVRVSTNESISGDIKNGDILVVDKSRDVVNGCLVVAYLDGEFCLKYFKKDKTGAYLSSELDGDKLIEIEDEALIFGVVSGLVRKY